MGKRQSQAWKALEREAAEALGGKRVSRGDDFSRSDVDVVVPDFPLLRVDCKYRKAHAHHSLLDEVVEKYCPTDEQIPVLVTKHHRQQGANVTITLVFFASLLDNTRYARRVAEGFERHEDGRTEHLQPKDDEAA